MRMRAIRLIAVAALAGCSGSSQRPAPAGPSQADAERFLAAAPAQRTLVVNGSQLVVIDIPQQEPDTKILEIQRCYIWRDADYKSATISCPHQPVWPPAGVDSSGSTYTGESEP